MKANGRKYAVVGRAACLAALAAGALWLAGRPASSGLAADKGEAPKAAAGLDLVPADGVAVFSVRFADLWDHKAFKAAREKMAKQVPDFEGHAAKEIGVPLDEIERVTGLLPSIESRRNLLVFVTTIKPYDAKKLLTAAIPDLAEEKIKERTSFVRPTGGAIALLDDRTFVAGPEDEVRAYLKQTEPAKDGALAPVLRAAAGSHLLVAGLDTEMLVKVASHDTASPTAEALKPLLKARSALLTVDLGDDVKAGKPLLSWRVAVLPYIEQDNLYKQFHLDEPWDSDHNKKLLERMPPLYGFGDEKAAKNHETHYQGFAGKGAFFDGKKGLKIVDITDGTSNTIMLVEAKKAVPWTKPDDVPFDAGKLVPKLGGLFDGIFNVAMCDGSVRSFPLTIKEDTLRALVTINGGEVVDPNK